jgi:hypothetical protein
MMSNRNLNFGLWIVDCGFLNALPKTSYLFLTLDFGLRTKY